MKQQSRLFWRCRRGMKEMDILLLYYLENYYDQASSKEQHSFADLLEENDMDILSWIMYKTPAQKKYRNIIQNIAESAKELQQNLIKIPHEYH